MSDVFSFGVVLLELLTGRKAVDKSRPGREKDLVEWGRPLLKDINKLEAIIDPRLDGRYSMEGARKLAALAYQCLSRNPKSRPSMSSVIKTLEPLLDLKDIPIGPFVYIAPTQGGNGSGDGKKKEKELELDEGSMEKKQEEEEKREVVRKRHPRSSRRGRRGKAMARAFRSRAVHSDTELYRRLKSSPYSLRQ